MNIEELKEGLSETNTVYGFILKVFLHPLRIFTEISIQGAHKITIYNA